MKIKSAKLFTRLLLLLAILVLPHPRAEAQTSSAAIRITQAVDEKNLVTLKGNVHPLARAEFDKGAVGDGQPLHRMLLLLQQSADQETSLQKLLDDQQNKSSANYHAWLTPAQFGQQFGPADADIQTVTNWLQSHGFQITNVTAGRTVIEFSGNVAQVRNAFHTEIHKYVVNGEAHMANASDPQIPAALAPVVAGPVSLNNFPISSHIRKLGTFHRAKGSSLAQPLYTFPGCTPAGCFGLGPTDFATIYNSAPLLTGTPKIDGTGQTIAIVGESDIDPTDVTDFQTMFGMTPNFSAAINIIVNGADPGVNGSEGESDLDVQWAGAVAPGATIKFVTSEPTETTAGTVLSAIYIVENNFAGVLSESFGGCEQQIGTLNQFHNSLWEQAAAQGITVMVSAGDGGSAGCDNFDTAQTATLGLAVSGFASTPFNVAVGGTDFDEVNEWSHYWSTTNNATNESSALSYIPEIPWNESCAQLGIDGCGSSAPNGSLNIVAGSGGVSTLYAKPSWQSGIGVPADGQRDLPDVSLFASPGFDGTFYIICQKDATNVPSCNLSDLGVTFQGAGGTSASAPAFAGIMALVNQSQATPSIPAPRQGNANYVLYSLFRKQTSTNPALNCSSSAASPSCTFYDVTHGNSALVNGTGTNSVPCTGGSPNCSVTVAGSSNGVLVTAATPPAEAYTVGTGYDLVTGLGSVNVANLVKNWSSITFSPSTTTLSAMVNGQAATSITGITHGTPVSVSSSVTAGQGATGTPSGQIVLMATPNPTPGSLSANFGIEALSLTSGAATGTGVILPGGTYNLTAHYQGDGTFGSSDSTPGIPVTITSESSKTLISLPTFNSTSGPETGNAPTSLVYGSLYLARIDVGNAQAKLSSPPQQICIPPACPTGTITWTDSLNAAPAVPLDGGSFTLNSAGFTEDRLINLGGGAHQLTASYDGDSSFTPSSANYSLTVTPAPTFQQWSNSVSSVVVNQPFALGVVVDTGVAGVSPTGTVTFLDGTTPLAGTVTYMAQGQNSNVVLYANTTTSISTGGTHTLTASYSGDANYAASSSSPVQVQALYPTTTTISLSSTEIPFGSSVTATVTVTTNIKSPAITGSILLQTSPGQPATPLTVTNSTDANGNTMLTGMTTVTPQGPVSFNAGYSGDSNFARSSASVFVQVDIPDFTLTVPTSPVVINIGQTGMFTFSIAPASNASSPVALSCVSPPVGYSCNIQPPSVNLANGATSNATLTLAPQNSANQAVKSARSAGNRPSLRFVGQNYLMAMGGLLTGIAAFILVRPREQKRHWSTMFVFAAACFLGLFGCGGGSSGGGGGSSPSATTITLTSSAPKASPFTSVTFTATVTGQGTPTGTVTFLSSDDIIGQVTLLNGTATATTEFGNPGIWSITAQYSGDGRNQAVTSAVLNQGVTGNLSSVVQGQTGTLTHVSAFTVTMQ
jgi:pro-kumamolisin-like protein/Big-like domain-containing protein